MVQPYAPFLCTARVAVAVISMVLSWIPGCSKNNEKIFLSFPVYYQYQTASVCAMSIAFFLMCGAHYKLTIFFIIRSGGGDSSVVRAPDSWLKGRGFETPLERREIFFSRVDFLCRLLFRYPFHPRVTAVARKKSRSFCQKCRWQVTAKHAYTLRMWLLLNRASALVTTCP